MPMPHNRREAILETAENAAAAHPEWSRLRCLKEAVRIVRRLETLIEAKFATIN